MCFMELFNLLSSTMITFRWNLRGRLRSLPQYMKPYCLLFRRILGCLGLYVIVTSFLAVFWYASFQRPNLQVYGVVLSFQLIVIGWASGLLRVLSWISECLHAKMIVHLISAIYFVQMAYLLLRLDDSQFILRGGISYAITTLFYPCVLYQLPIWRRKRLWGTFYWSSVSQVTFLIGTTAYLIQFLLQNPCSPSSPSSPEKASALCATNFTSTTNLDWISLNYLTLLKIVTLFTFQAMAYHVAAEEEIARNTRPVPINRRSG